VSNQVEAVDLCLQYGAELDIPDGDGVLPSSLMKFASPGIHVVIEKHMRKREGKEAPMEDKNKCVACGVAGGKSQCARCRVIRYCGPQFQGTLTAFNSITITLRIVDAKFRISCQLHTGRQDTKPSVFPLTTTKIELQSKSPQISPI
jgi:hypothetical protein